MILPASLALASDGTDARAPAAGPRIGGSLRVTTYAPNKMSAPPAKVYASSGSRRKRKDRTAATTTSSRIKSPEIVGEIVRRLATYNMSGVKAGKRPRYAIPSQPLAFVGSVHHTH